MKKKLLLLTILLLGNLSLIAQVVHFEYDNAGNRIKRGTCNATIDLGPDISICQGQSLTLDAASDFETYKWNGNIGERTLDVNIAGTYVVEGINSNGCTSSDEITITVLPLPVVDLGDDIAVSSRSTYELGTSGSFQSYLWNTGSTNSILTVEGSSIIEDTEFILEVTDDNNCKNSDNILLYIATTPRGTVNSNNNLATNIDVAKYEDLSIYNIFPNPTNGKFYISISKQEKIKQIDLFDMHGNLIRSYKNIENFPMEVNLSNQSKGTYLLRISEEKSFKEFKIINQ